MPPHSDDAERSVLGAVLLDPAALDDVAELIKPEDFYRSAHGHVFAAMLAISSRNEPVDRVAVKSQIEQMGLLGSVGGEDLLDLLDKVVPVSANSAHYAAIVADRALRRRVITHAQEIARAGYEGEGTARDFADRSEARLFEAAAQHRRGGFVSAGSQIHALQKSIDAAYQRDTAVTGAPTGITKLDEMLSGLQPGQLITIGARPSMGKSAFALDIARSVARAPAPVGGTVGFFSLEMPTAELMQRLASVEARVDLQRVRNGRLLESDFPKLVQAFGDIEQLALEFDDAPRVTLSHIRSAARRLASRLAATGKRLGAIVVDYLQLMDHGRAHDGENDAAAIGRTTGGFKSLAKELSIPVILLSQLNRKLEDRPDKRPRQSDLRDSGSIEQDSDVIIFLYRGEIYTDDREAKPGEAEIIVAKQRNGPPGTVHAAFVGKLAHYTNLESEKPAVQPSLGLRFDGYVPPESENP